MDFQNLMGGNCGEVNSWAQFAQHAVQDVARQDSIGQPSTSSGLAPNNFMPPQSFRMHDLMNEIKSIEPQTSCIPAIPEYRQTTDYSNMMQSRNQSQWNIGLPSPQVFLPSYPQHEFQPQAKNSSGYLKNEFGVVVDSLDQLDDIYKCQKEKNQPLEKVPEREPLEREPKPVKLQKYWKGIPIHNEGVLTKRLANKTEAYTFLLSLWDYGDKCIEEERDLKNTNKRYELVLTKETVLKYEMDNEYPYIKDNPVRDCDTPTATSKQELFKGNIENAILYADEAARRNPADIDRWLHLLSLYQMQLQNDESFFVAKQVLRLDPNNIFAYKLAIISYLHVGCYFEAFETMVFWLKSHEFYTDIPVSFLLKENLLGLDGHSRTWIKSNQHIVDGVKNMFLIAARRNPTNVDFDVQAFLSYIFTFTKEFDKSSDCLTTIARSKVKSLRNPRACYNAAFNLFLDGQPLEALKDLLIGITNSTHKVKLITCELIGIIFMYLTNYREAIRYFKEALEIDPSDEEFALPTEGDILKAENELCLRLFSKLYSSIKLN